MKGRIAMGLGFSGDIVKNSARLMEASKSGESVTEIATELIGDVNRQIDLMESMLGTLRALKHACEAIIGD